MKSIKALSFILWLLTLILTSCSMEKRVYRLGYHIEWNSTKREAARTENTTQISPQQLVTHLQTGAETLPATNPALPADDVAVASDDSAAVALHKTIAFSTRENIFTIAPAPVSEGKTIQDSEITPPKNQAAQNTSAGPDGKSQLVALLLCILLGALGIHRFYLGYPGIAILMLFTGGLCGILALIDLIRIITGDLKPKNGEYADKL